jgi:hypothetical protein
MRYPGAAYPDDFGLPFVKKLIEALKSGMWAIDWWEGDPRENIDGDSELSQTYFVRPATIRNRHKLFDGTWGGQCIFFGNSGCELDSDLRPTECRYLEPQPESHCNPHGMSKRGACLAWIPYQDILRNAERIIEAEK